MNRRDLYVTVTVPYLSDGSAVRDVLHPLPSGRIPDGYAATEKHYRNETQWTVRSERETERTASNMRGAAL